MAAVARPLVAAGFVTPMKRAMGTTLMASALQNPQVIDNFLQSQVQSGRVAGPFSESPLSVLHVSHFSIIPKHHQPGKRHLILDLSTTGLRIILCST